MIPFVPYIVAGVAALIVLFTPRGKDILVPVALLPWMAFEIHVGATLTVSQVLFMLLLPKYVGYVDLGRTPKSTMYLLLALAISLVGASLTIAANPFAPVFEGGPLRNGYGRVFTVAVMTAVSFIPWFVILRFGQRIDPVRLMRVYIYSCALLSIFGLVQFAVWRATGTDIFPVGIFGSEETQRTGLMTVGGDAQLRISSLGGEPKTLSMSLTIAVLLLVLGDRLELRRLRRAALAALFLVCIALSAATSALLTLPAAAAIIFAFSRLHAPMRRANIFVLLAFIGTAIFFAYFAFVNYNDLEPFVASIQPKDFLDSLWQRSVGRFELDDFDHVIMDTFLDVPSSILFGRGLGLVHYYAYEFIPPYYMYYMEGRLLSAKSGVTFLVSNAGLVGMLLFLAFVAAQIPGRRNLDTARHSAVILKVQAISVSLMVVLLLRFYVWEICLTLIPALWVLASRVGKFAHLPYQHRVPSIARPRLPAGAAQRAGKGMRSAFTEVR